MVGAEEDSHSHAHLTTKRAHASSHGVLAAALRITTTWMRKLRLRGAGSCLWDSLPSMAELASSTASEHKAQAGAGAV